LPDRQEILMHAVAGGLPGESAYWRDPAELTRTLGLNPRQIERATERAASAFYRIRQALG
jgi:hypothetical protein